MSRSGTANLLLRIVDSSDPMRRDLERASTTSRIPVSAIVTGCTALAAAALFLLR